MGRASGARTSVFFLTIPRITSWWTTSNSEPFLVLHDRDSVPTGSLSGSISNLVCVCVCVCFCLSLSFSVYLCLPVPVCVCLCLSLSVSQCFSVSLSAST